MGEWIELTAADGHQLAAYKAEPAEPPRAGLVVVQEIFGVNSHVREVTDQFSAAGYRAIAPAYFDRTARNIELDYGEDDIAEGRRLRSQLAWVGIVADTDAAITALETSKVGLVGYCFGGTVAWVAADACQLDAAVGYYGGQIPDEAGRQPKCPVMLHFGAEDAAIPLESVEAVKTAHPSVPIYIYDGAGHGFNCDRRSSYHADAARLANERTLAFLSEHLS